jgi:hypothetical protein
MKYHAEELAGINSTFANRIKTIAPSLEAVAALLED